MESINIMKDLDVAYETLAGFTGDAPKAELCLDLQDMSDSEGDGPNGNAGPSGGTLNDATVTITINSEQLNRSKLSIARTMLHEMIHAELWGMVIEAGGYNHLQQFAATYEGDDDFMMIWEYYDTYGPYNSDLGNTGWQHEYMADFYIQYITEGLEELSPFLMSQSFSNYWDGQQFCPENLDCFEWNWDDFYKSLAWQGLTETEEWDGKSDNFKKIMTNYANQLNQLEGASYKCQ